MKPIFYNTEIFHEKNDLTTEQQAMSLKNRIDEMKRSKTNLYIGQPKAVQTDDECYNEIAVACEKFINERSEENEQNLAKTLEKHNLHLYCYSQKEISIDKNLVARMAFDGHVDKPFYNQLSETFRKIKDNSDKRAVTKPEDYNMENSSVWNIFKQIPEFAAIEDRVKKGLSIFGIPPEKLPELQVKDFCYIINEQMRDPDNGGSVKVFKDCYKVRHTKRFIEENEEEFRAGLLAMPGVKKEYVKTLIRAMHKGITDLTKYKENGQHVMKEEWANQPVIDIHHIVNIKDSATKEAQGQSWTNINDYENMCFIVRYPQHDAMHNLEHKLRDKYKYNKKLRTEAENNLFHRIQPPEGVRCMLGFHNMIYDRKYLGLPEKEKAEIKEKAENNKNRISGSHGRNSWRGNPKNNPYAQRRDWKQERGDYVRH